MAAKSWGVFLCNCRSTLTVEAERLAGVASLVTVASEPEKEIAEFARLADEQDVENVIIGCCASPELFEEALGARRLSFVDLKGQCFGPHKEPGEAHGKALRMISGAMVRALRKKDVTHNLLKVGGRVLIYTDSALGLELAEKLKELEEITIVATPGAAGFDELPGWKVSRGAIGAIAGRLGNFLVTVQPYQEPDARPRAAFDVAVDQVVLLAKEELPYLQGRTGIHVIPPSGNGTLQNAAQQVLDHVGLFHKPEHLSYDTKACAGGAAGMQTCGRCLPACPYGAIARDGGNELRVVVDHLTCEGCGACAAVCPTSALRFTEPSPAEIYGQLAGYLADPPAPRGDGAAAQGDAGAPPVVVFHCEQKGRQVLAEAGSRPIPYSAAVLPVEVPCTRYVSEALMLEALSMGAGGVALLGCENCPNGERELLLEKLEFAQLVLNTFGLGGERVRLFTADEGGEAEAVAALDRFAGEVGPTPCKSGGKPPRRTGNREIVADAIRGFIAHTGKEPGGIKVPEGQPYGYVEIKDSGCTLCRACANVCPTHAFKFDEAEQVLSFKHINCVACGMCEKSCPENVITLKAELYLESQALDYMTVVEDESVDCAKCGKPYINRRALEAIEAKVLNLESLLDTFSGERRGLLRMCPDCRAVSAMWDVDQGWEP